MLNKTKSELDSKALQGDFPYDIRFESTVTESVLGLNDRGWGYRVKSLPSVRKSLDFICKRRDTGGKMARRHTKPENGNKERKRRKCMLR